MCGIAGVFGNADPQTVPRMIGALAHRGPDGHGVFERGDVQLGSARLAIIDIAGGSQPMVDEASGRCVVFNGEIFNHRELRSELKRRGYRFSSSCDTEVVLHAFSEWGEACVERLSGMYAFAVSDGEGIFLARDPFGIKPLYYAQVPSRGLFLFASEIKGLLASRYIRPSLRECALADYIILGHLVGEDTFFEQIQSYPPGHAGRVAWGNGRIAFEPYRFHRSRGDTNTLSFEEALDRLDAHLADSVASHLVADVPVGLTLSGGIDSALLAHYVTRQCHDDTTCFTIADSSVHADAQGAKVAAHGLPHALAVARADRMLAVLPRCIAAVELPLSAVVSFLLFEAVARSHKVCLDGEGADELFGGYNEYVAPEAWLDALFLRRRHLAALGLQPSPTVDEVVAGLARACESADGLRRAVFDLGLGSPLTRRHLEIVDKCAMAHGVEVRVPYLDDALASFAASLPLEFKVDPASGARKRVLRRLAERKLPRGFFDILPERKIGLLNAGLRPANGIRDLLETLGAAYRSRHPLRAVRRSAYDLLVYDLFEEIFVVSNGQVADDFDIFDAIAAKLEIQPQTLRAAVARLC